MHLLLAHLIVTSVLLLLLGVVIVTQGVLDWLARTTAAAPVAQADVEPRSLPARAS